MNQQSRRATERRGVVGPVRLLLGGGTHEPLFCTSYFGQFSGVGSLTPDSIFSSASASRRIAPPGRVTRQCEILPDLGPQKHQIAAAPMPVPESDGDLLVAGVLADGRVQPSARIGPVAFGGTVGHAQDAAGSVPIDRCVGHASSVKVGQKQQILLATSGRNRWVASKAQWKKRTMRRNHERTLSDCGSKRRCVEPPGLGLMLPEPISGLSTTRSGDTPPSVPSPSEPHPLASCRVSFRPPKRLRPRHWL